MSRTVRLLLGTAMLLVGCLFLHRYAQEWVLPAISIGIFLGVLISLAFIILPARKRIQLLHDGDHDAYHAINDAVIQRTKAPRARAVLELNRATAFFQAGELERGVTAMDALGPERFRGVTKSLYWLNLLTMLCHTDPERATRVMASEDEHLNPHRQPKLNPHLRDLHRVYRLMVENSVEDEAHFRERTQHKNGVLRAFAHYYLARVFALQGKTNESLATYESGRAAWPPLQLPPPTGPAVRRDASSANSSANSAANSAATRPASGPNGDSGTEPPATPSQDEP